LTAQLAKRIGLRGRLVGIMLKPMMLRAGQGDEAEHLLVFALGARAGLDAVMTRAQDAQAMAQLPPSQGPGQVSPDGRWWWDGRQWVPNTPTQLAPPAYMVAAGQPGMVVAPKNPAVSLIVSFFVPGVGSMINGDVGTGIAILVLYLVGWALAIFLIGFILVIGAWIWGMIDAYQGAQRWNARHGIIS